MYVITVVIRSNKKNFSSIPNNYFSRPLVTENDAEEEPEAT